jgi:uncharacterized protein YqjF (DUF2071 family)
MTQTWHDVLFAHWPVDPALLRANVPGSFPLDLFEGRAWIGVVPFQMTNVAPRGMPALPWVSAFPELNVRTYVRVGEKAGVYFFSLDAGSAVAVTTARMLLNLPYHVAAMSVEPVGQGVNYRSARRDDAGARFEATYEPAGQAFQPLAGTLEHFLTERYCLYHLDHGGSPYRLNIHHAPWSLQPAHASIAVNTMRECNGLTAPDVAPLLHFAKRQDMVAWAPEGLA